MHLLLKIPIKKQKKIQNKIRIFCIKTAYIKFLDKLAFCRIEEKNASHQHSNY